MKTIKNPSSQKIGLILTPIPILCVLVIILRSLPTWILIAGAISLLTYMALMTYFCIKQKCFTQLCILYIIVIVWIATFIIQFNYIPKIPAEHTKAPTENVE